MPALRERGKAYAASSSGASSVSSAAALAARSSLRIEFTPDFPDGPLVRLLLADLSGQIFAAAQLTLDLDMGALLERGGELSELAEDNATVPFRVLDVLGVLRVGALGCH